MAVISQLKLNSISGLPNEYKQVEYIESTGTQWIDSGYIANNNTRVVIDYQFTSLIDSFLLGCRNNSTSNAYTVNLAYSGKNAVTSYGNTGNTQFGDADVNRHIVDKNKNKFYFDGELLLIQTENSFTCPSSLEIFSCHNGDTSGYLPSLARIYSLKIYDDDMIVKDFIPCVRKVDNTAGLYDLVNNKFYTNEGTGEFTVGNEVGKVVTRYNKSTISKITVDDVDYHFAKSNEVTNGVCENAVNEPIIDMNIKGNSIQRLLPEEYQEVEYLENSGIQRIDTGLVPTSSTSIDITYQSMAVVGKSQYILGSRENASTVVAYALNGSSTNNYWDVRFNGVATSILAVNRSTDKYRSIVELNEGNGSWTLTNLTTNETNEMTLSGAVVNATANLYLFAYNQIDANTHTNLRIFACKIYENRVLIRNYIPCYRKSDKVAGLYDLVANVFYTNSGTGTFVVGSDYETSPNIEQHIEIQSAGDKTLNLLNPNAKLEDIKAYYGINLTGIDKKYGLLIKLKEDKTVPTGSFFGLARYVTETSSATASWVVSNGALVKAFGDGQTYAFLSFNPSGNWLAGLACYPKTQEAWDSLMDAFEIMWVEGDYKLETMLEYEPYGYKIPISIGGKNLVNVLSDKNTYGYLDENGNIVSHGAIKYTDFIGVGNVTQITFSGMGSNGMSAPATCFYDKNKNFISGVAFGGAGEKTIDIPQNAKYFRTCFRTSYTEFMAEFGSAATSYVAYLEPTTTNIYLKEPLRMINDVADVLDYKNKKVIRNVGSVIYDATESWSKYDSGNGYMETNTIFPDGKPVLCNMFVNTPSLIKTLAIRKNYANIYVYGVQDYFPTQAEWHAFLVENNMEVIGQLVTPTEESINIPLIKTFDKTTNISVNTKLVPSSTSLSYWKQI